MVTKRIGFYDLRDWWLSEQRLRELLVDPRLSQGNDADPFYPVAQQPESGFPYIRYGIGRDVAPSQWWMRTEQVMLEIFMLDIVESNEVVNIMIDMAGRESDSATDLTNWLVERNNELQEQEEPPVPIDYVYHSIKYMGSGEIEATEEEGGHHSVGLMFSIYLSPKNGRGIA